MSRIVSFGAFLLVAFLVLGLTVSGPPSGVDRFVAESLGNGWQDTAGDVASVGSAVLGPVLPVVAALGLLVAAVVVRRRGRPELTGLLLRATLLLAVCRTVSFAKPLFERTRPRVYPDFSFPSGHVVSVASVGFTAAVLCAWLARERLRLVVALSAVAVFLAALCRVLLDVHWLTDVVGATLGVVGLGLMTAAALRLLPARGPTA
ncbi:phosphatase PAP2 family protein [Actinokineospora iranica]|uniref:Undecaprenyl-diphosphatase n=1 Tax=Actinokineospora iranica TaxID=1271860 RepID=A0A1G6MX07_9PSEU|nr:phosphatase PAP2 family protein [Actinokineospora iranica]SDC60072.1 undecaprenyl-diphosphatase [Actinokineospora iranica]